MRWKSGVSCDTCVSLTAWSISNYVTVYFCSVTSVSRPCFSILSSSALRVANSFSSLVCERLAGTDSRRMRSWFTNPILRSAASAASVVSAGRLIAAAKAAIRKNLCMLIPSFTRRRSKCTAQQKLETLHTIIGINAQRLGQAELQRTHRRIPAHREAERRAQIPERHSLVRTEYITGIDECRQAHRFILHARYREQDFKVADQALVAAQKLIGKWIAWTERALLEAAHRINAAGIEILEEWKRLAAVTIDKTILHIGVKNQGTPDRPQVLGLSVDAIVLYIAAGQPRLAADGEQIATRREVDAVARIARIADRAPVGIAAAAEGIDVIDITLRAGGIHHDIGQFPAEAEIHAIILGDGNAESHSKAGSG